MSDGAQWTKGLRDTSCFLLVEEKPELLRSTGKACQELEIALTVDPKPPDDLGILAGKKPITKLPAEHGTCGRHWSPCEAKENGGVYPAGCTTSGPATRLRPDSLAR